jgi:hypothetical protein
MDALYKSKLEAITEGHVFYRFQDEEIYIKNLISFINTGLERKEHILIIESMRNLPRIIEEINSRYNDEQQSAIQLVNNFDYYLSSGDFNTQTILNHFQKDLDDLQALNSSIRTWAHVEWAAVEPDAELLKAFESQADDFVIKEGMVSVCAYASPNLTSPLNIALEQFHKYVMTDDKFAVSSLYGK